MKNGFSNGDSVISPRILEIGESKLYTCIGVFVWKKIGSFEYNGKVKVDGYLIFFDW